MLLIFIIFIIMSEAQGMQKILEGRKSNSYSVYSQPCIVCIHANIRREVEYAEGKSDFRFYLFFQYFFFLRSSPRV